MKPAFIDFQRVDVRPMLARGIEPLAVIRQRVAALGQSQGLVVIAPFLPSPLVELMRGEGFESKIEPADGGDWIVYFWHKSPEG
jgi:hypothetical protein